MPSRAACRNAAIGVLLVEVVGLGEVEHIEPAQRAVAAFRDQPLDRLRRLGVGGVPQDVEQGLCFAHGREIALKPQREKA